jgi:adenylate kinase family enzyme
MRRVAVRGASGSGKTTFSATLAGRLGVPHIELDALHHGPNWTEASAEEFQARLREALAAAPDGWVVDGNYERKLGTLVADLADTVIWLDMPLPLMLGRITLRSATRIVRGTELWNGNRETWRGLFWGRDSLLPWTIRAYFRHRAEYPRYLALHPGYVRLRTPAAARRWLAEQRPEP